MSYLLPLSMLVALALGIFSGYPVALLLGGLSVLFMLIADLPLASFLLIVSRVFGAVLENWILAAIPLFVFMGLMLEKSRIADSLLNELEKLFGGRPGGLGLSVVIIGIVMAASTGIIGASVVLMGAMALPKMLGQGYHKSVAIGTVLGSGTLGILIPPSIMLVVFGDVMQVPIGGLFAAALIPGLLLGLCYAAYVIVTAIFRPERVPARQSSDEAGGFPALLRVLKNLILPALLMASVLVSIIAGIATPTEGAAIGALAALLMALSRGHLSFRVLVDCAKETTLTTAMILVLAIGATAFSLVFQRVGGQDMIVDGVNLLGGNATLVLVSIMIMTFILGFFLEWIEISFLVLPLFAPIVAGLSFDNGLADSQEVLLWFGALMAVNLQTSFLTPPFGYALFYLKGIAPPEVSTMDIYRAIIPIVLIQLFGLLLIGFFPEIALWLPRML